MISVNDAVRGAAFGELSGFRQELYQCLRRRADALFELSDAMLCTDGPVTSLVGLSLAAEHRRGHGALYDAVNNGVIEVDRLRRALAGLPLPRDRDGRLVLAVDVSAWLRPDGATCPDRSFCHVYGRGRRRLAHALEANERWERLAGELQAENARLRERDAQREAELERVSAELAVLQRLVFGRSSERTRPDTAGPGADSGGHGATGDGDGGQVVGGPRRGRGGQAGRRDYSYLPRVEVVWDFAGGGYCCPGCGSAFTLLGDHTVEQIDWQVVVRVLVHRRRRYQRRCPCQGPRTVGMPYHRTSE